LRHDVLLPLARSRSISNPLHVFEQNLLTAAVIEFRGPAVSVAGDPLSGFKGASRVPSFSKKFVMPVARKSEVNSAPATPLA
jgi:hypothetical protein